MKITDDQIATLHAQLTGQTTEYERRLDALTTEEAQKGYTTLVTAAFFEAVDRRFTSGKSGAHESEIIDFIATKREMNAAAAELLDPSVAEQVLLSALGKGSIDRSIDADTLMGTQVLLLAALIGEADLSDTELEDFLAKARAEADAHID